MQVNKEPPSGIVKNSFIYHWEEKARKFFHYFEVHKLAAHEWIQRVQKNPLTKTQEFLRYHNKLKSPDILELRQQLGDVTKAEVSGLNSSFGSESSYLYRKGRSEPAKIVAYRKNILLVAGAGALGVAYTMLYHRKGFVWWVAPFLPLVFYICYNRARQPAEDIANGYRFILAKRTASALMQEKEKDFSQIVKDNAKLKELGDYLKVEKKTVYELEKKMMEDIVKGTF